MRRLAAAWRRYWFSPTPLLDIAFARIAIVGFQLWAIGRPWYRAQLQARTLLPDSLYDPLPILHLIVLPFGWTYRPGAVALDAALYATIAMGVLAFVGLWTRYSLAFFALGCAFLQAFLYSFGDFHHPEAVVIIALGLLALAPAGGALSVDDLRRRLGRASTAGSFLNFDLKHEESRRAGWPLKTVGWVFVLVYASAAYFKLRNGGFDWTNGYTLRYWLLQDAVRHDNPLGYWAAGQQPVAVLLSWGSVVVEGTFVMVMLLPITRWFYLPAGAGMHLGIEALMRASFESYLFAYSVFIPWRDGLERAARRFGRPEQSVAVLFDDRCTLCIRSATFLRYWDWLERLQLQPLQEAVANPDPSTGVGLPPGIDREVLAREMHVILPDGSVERGFTGWRRLLRELPPLWPLVPILHLPGADRVGRFVYRLSARRRSRILRDGGGCALHSDR